MEPIITNEFPKQPRESRWCPVSFAEQLAAFNDTPRAVDPIELDPVPDGITVLEQVFDTATNRYHVLVAGGVSGRKYKLTMWINTTSGQRLEHDITIKVKEQ